MLAAVGVKVTLVESRPRLLEFIDDEIGEMLQFRMRDMGIRLRLGESVSKIEARRRRRRSHAGQQKDIYSPNAALRIGRQGATETVEPPRGRPDRRQSRPIEGQRILSDRRPAHLRRRRRDRISGPGRHQHGAGPPGGLPHVPPAHRAAPSRSSPTASTPSPKSAWSARPSRP